MSKVRRQRSSWSAPPPGTHSPRWSPKCNSIKAKSKNGMMTSVTSIKDSRARRKSILFEFYSRKRIVKVPVLYISQKLMKKSVFNLRCEFGSQTGGCFVSILRFVDDDFGQGRLDLDGVDT